jgi:hypothetical protein
MTLTGLTRTLHESAAPLSAGPRVISPEEAFDVLDGIIGRDPATGRRQHSIEEVRAAIASLRRASVTDQTPLGESDYNRMETALRQIEAYQSDLDRDLSARSSAARAIQTTRDRVSSTPVAGVWHAARPHMRDDTVLRRGGGNFDLAAMRERFTQIDWDGRRTWEDRSRCGPASVMMAALEAQHGNPRALDRLVDSLLQRVATAGQTHAGQRDFLTQLRTRLQSGGDISASDLGRLCEHMLHIHQRAAGERGLHGSTPAMIRAMMEDAGLSSSGPPTAASPRVATIDWQRDGHPDHAVTVGVAEDGRRFIWDPFPRYNSDGSPASQMIYEGTPGFSEYAALMDPPVL